MKKSRFVSLFFDDSNPSKWSYDLIKEKKGNHDAKSK